MREQFRDAQDIDIAISNGLSFHFDDIPKHLQSDEMALEWFLAMMAVPGERPLDLFLQVPSELWSQAFLVAVSGSDCNMLAHKDLDLGKNSLYQSVGLNCIRKNYKHLSSLDPKYRTMVAEHLAWNFDYKVHLVDREFPWFRDHLDPGELERCCTNIHFALDTKDLPESMRRRILINGENFHIIRARGRLGLLSEQIAEGEWPKTLTSLDFAGPMPISLEDGIHKIVESAARVDQQALYMAAVMTYPMDEAVSMMCERRLHKLVLEMYSQEALAPYLKKYRDLRGVVLEDALGL
jgi:hypothetical protein